MPAVFLVRRCQPSLLKAQQRVLALPGWTVCGSSERVRDVATIVAKRPDFVACDLRLLDGDANWLAYALRRWPRRPQLLLLATSEQDLLLPESLHAGANGYCVDGGDGRGLVAGLQQLAEQRATMSPLIAQRTLALVGLPRTSLAIADDPTAASDQDLTPRGLQRSDQHLLSLLAHGLLCAEIAERWRLGVTEIEQRLWRLYERLPLLAPLPAPGLQAA